MDSEWFFFPTAETFTTERAARTYAESFARNQASAQVYGAHIEVRARSGGRHGQLVATYKSDAYFG